MIEVTAFASCASRNYTGIAIHNALKGHSFCELCE